MLGWCRIRNGEDTEKSASLLLSDSLRAWILNFAKVNGKEAIRDLPLRPSLRVPPEPLAKAPSNQAIWVRTWLSEPGALVESEGVVMDNVKPKVPSFLLFPGVLAVKICGMPPVWSRSSSVSS
jgi:hypothetical protein